MVTRVASPLMMGGSEKNHPALVFQQGNLGVALEQPGESLSLGMLVENPLGIEKGGGILRRKTERDETGPVGLQHGNVDGDR